MATTSIPMSKGLEALPKMSLAEVNLTMFPNSRNEAESPEKTFELMQSILQQGLLAAPVIGETKDSKKGAVAGFRRLLAIRWIALADLFKEANKGKKVADEGYLDIRSQDDHAKLKVANKAAYEQAIKDMMVPYVLTEVTGKNQAAVLNFVENYQRQNLSPRDTCKRIAEILGQPDDDGEPVSAASLARQMSCSQSKISQWKKLGGLPEYLSVKMTTPESGETLSDDELAQVKTEAKVLVADYEERFGLLDGPTAIDFQHARELSNTIMPTGKKEPPTRKVVLSIMEKFLGWSKTTNALDPKRQTPDLSVLTTQIKNELHKAGEGDATVVAEAEVTTATGVETPVSELTGATTAAVPAGTTAAATATAEETRLQAAEAEVATANGATTAIPAGATATVAGATVTNTEDAAVAGGGVNAPPTKKKAGQEMPAAQKYAAAYTGEEIENFAYTALEIAFDGEQTAANVIMFLAQASGAFEILKFKAEQKKVDDILSEVTFAFDQAIETYDKVKDVAIASNLPVKGVNLKELRMPTPVMPQWVKERLAENKGEVVAANPAPAAAVEAAAGPATPAAATTKA